MTTPTMPLPPPGYATIEALKGAALTAARLVLNEHRRSATRMRELATAGRLVVHLSRQPLLQLLEREAILVEPEYATAGLDGDEKRALLRGVATAGIVRPDVIVHKRGHDGPNCMVIEIKMGEWLRGPRLVDRDDQRKLEALTDPQQHGYSLGLWFGLPRDYGNAGYYAEFRQGNQNGGVVPIP